MRILAIRGKNLASLAGEFEIDFVSGPLAELRLFAITGPTGVGKSTILDALCGGAKPRGSRRSTSSVRTGARCARPGAWDGLVGRRTESSSPRR